MCVLLRAESVFSTALWVSHMQVSLAFKAGRVLSKAWGPLPHAGAPVWGAHCGTWAPHLGRIPAIMIIILYFGHLQTGMGLSSIVSPPFLPSLLGSFFFLSFFFFAALHGMWDLSSLTKDRTHAPCRGSTEI